MSPRTVCDLEYRAAVREGVLQGSLVAFWTLAAGTWAAGLYYLVVT